MAPTPSPTDVTATVPLDDAAAVAATCEQLLGAGGESFDRDLLHATFAYADDLFAGRNTGYLACDMPYHDLRHSLDAALVTARMVAGGRAEGGTARDLLTAEIGLAAVLLALLHDTGFLRRRDEANCRGPDLAAVHETRSAELARTYLGGTALARHADLAAMIAATRLATAPADLFRGQAPAAKAVGCLLGSADLFCQLADPLYLERCYHHLFPELVLGAEANAIARPFASARDLIAATRNFHDAVAAPRLARAFADAPRWLARHFGGRDPYAESIRANLARCALIVEENRWDLLGPPPPTTTHPLDPLYATVR